VRSSLKPKKDRERETAKKLGSKRKINPAVVVH